MARWLAVGFMVYVAIRFVCAFVGDVAVGLDRNVQTVSVNQIVVLEGYAGGSYVVYDITRDRYGFTYHLVHTSTYDFNTSNLIRPLSDKFGIGIYYDSENPTFLDPLETAALLNKAKEKKAEQEQKDKEAREEYERISKIGAKRLRPLIPSDTKAVIVGELRVSECDSYTDYYDYRIERMVILGFSKHTRNLFSEMRKCAVNFEGTAHFLTLTMRHPKRQERYRLAQLAFGRWSRIEF